MEYINNKDRLIIHLRKGSCLQSTNYEYENKTNKKSCPFYVVFIFKLGIDSKKIQEGNILLMVLNKLNEILFLLFRGNAHKQ